uniref:Uncharacterized protein n=1 Tax=Micrurus corallinus TaxID=54390 RepID=A0A2D4G0U4_MICCO
MKMQWLPCLKIKTICSIDTLSYSSIQLLEAVPEWVAMAEMPWSKVVMVPLEEWEWVAVTLEDMVLLMDWVAMVVAAEIVVDITGKATWEEVAGVECIEECHCVSKACWKETVLGLLDFLTKLKISFVLKTL